MSLGPGRRETVLVQQDSMMTRTIDRKIAEILGAATRNGEKDAPGAVFIATNRDGKQLAAQAAGVRGLKERKHMTLDAVGWLASCTKLYVMTAAMQLVEQGRIALDDSEQVSFFPSFSFTRNPFAKNFTRFL